METATKVSLSSLFSDGYRVRAHHKRVLFLAKEDEYGRPKYDVLWHTRKEEVIVEGKNIGYKIASPKSQYFLINEDYRREGVLNTSTGEMFLSEEYDEIKHLRLQYFEVVLRSGKRLLLDAENGRVAEGVMDIIGKHAIVDGRAIIELLTGKEIFRSEKEVSHIYGPYFLVGGWREDHEDQMIIHFKTSKQVVLPAIEGTRYDVKHIGVGKFLVTSYGQGKRKHAILTFRTGKMTPAT